MVGKCQDCGTIWTDNSAPQSVNPRKVAIRRCGDCATWDWPKWTKAIEYVKSLDLEGKNRKKKTEAKNK